MTDILNLENFDPLGKQNKKPIRKKIIYSSSSDSSDTEDSNVTNAEVEGKRPVKKKPVNPKEIEVTKPKQLVRQPTIKKPKRQVIEESSSSSCLTDSSDEPDNEPVKQKKIPASQMTTKPKNDIDDTVRQPQKKIPASQMTTKLKNNADDIVRQPQKKIPKQPVEETDSSTDSDDDIAPQKLPRKKIIAQIPKQKAVEPLDDNEELEKLPKKKIIAQKLAEYQNPPVKKQKAIEPLDDDDEFVDEEPEIPPQRIQRKQTPNVQRNHVSHKQSLRPLTTYANGILENDYNPPTQQIKNINQKSPDDWNFSLEHASTSLGLNKNIVTWEFIWKRKKNVIILYHSTFGGKRKLIVNGNTQLIEKTPFADKSRYSFKLGDTNSAVNVIVYIKSIGLTAFEYDLQIERMDFPTAYKYWFQHTDV
jgi:hypothetical protein